jgi:hypothetical protein
MVCLNSDGEEPTPLTRVERVGRVESQGAVALPSLSLFTKCGEGEFYEVQLRAAELRRVRRVIPSSCSQPSPTKE